MRVSVSLQVNLKDRSPEYLGLTQETFVIGKDAEVTLANMVIAFIISVEEMYGRCYSAETLNNELMEASKRIWDMRYEEN